MTALGVVLASTLAGCVRPEAIEDSVIAQRITDDRANLFTDQEPISGPLDLHDAMARGLKYNLDRRLKDVERSLALAKLQVVQGDLLPKLAAEAGYRDRNSFRASSSQSISTGSQSLEVSTSEDKRVRFGDLNAVWNVLDFGLTYVRSRQEADEVMIASERRVKVTQSLLLDIRDACWRAAAAQRLLPEVNRLLSEMRAALDRSRGLISSGVGEPADELKAQRQLIVHLRDLTDVRRKLLLARTELGALINVAPGQAFTVVSPKQLKRHVPHLKAEISELETAALANRPELREEDYKKRISELEVRASYLRLLPGLELRRGTNYDSNSFLLDHGWLSASAIVTKNLMEYVSAPRNIRFAETAVEVADARRIALSMAVVTQVHISLQRFGLARDVYAAAERLYAVDDELATVTTRGAAGKAGSEIEALEARARRMVSAVQYAAAYADVQNAYGKILLSVGASRLPEGIETQDVKSLSDQLRSTHGDWQSPVASLQLASR